MRKLLIALMLSVACGGIDTTPPVSVPPPAATVLQAGTYKPAGTTTAASYLAVPAGPAMVTTMIADWSGAVSMVLPNYDFVRAALVVAPNGTLQIGNGAVLVHQDGTTTPAVITGALSGTTISGTVNGTEAFTLVLTTIQNQAFTIAQMTGNYISTSTSTGAWVVISFDASGAIQGYVYASQADAQAGNTAKSIGSYQGTISHTGTRGPDGTVPPNTFDIGFCYVDAATGSRPPCTYGFAYFTTGGLVALTVNPVNGGQFTSVFSKQ